MEGALNVCIGLNNAFRAFPFVRGLFITSMYMGVRDAQLNVCADNAADPQMKAKSGITDHVRSLSAQNSLTTCPVWDYCIRIGYRRTGSGWLRI